MFGDLHIHTTKSDGTCKPKEVVQMAKNANLSAIAITDHDTLDGIDEAKEASELYGIEIIPGIELNSYDDRQDIHILGYFIDYKNNDLLEKLKDIRKSRINRAKLIISKLNEIGINITYDDVLSHTKESFSFIGRPHIAKAIVEAGYAKSVKEAFDKYIGEDKPAYVKRYRLHPFDSIKMIINAGGIPVLAHPGLLIDKEIIKHLITNGLKGIEVYHSKHSRADTEFFKNFALENNLLITGGSDFHGVDVDGEYLLGTVKLDYKYIEKLKECNLV
ncbi:PHP domain-containing protein [Thermoanaerobacterium butyriciformans]|uniref:Metal-dependent phosphoesterase TrpH n=1 Tax=Thermoanaerobacterium butyriciformans TaxID=1702242 RepID=A0ABS4NDB1_9THEO|nr:PHP domain-containing protein [Thermoanaerobacterium butyriciformans]MBP2071668.1 putative metal-dependent phosphoesterase TrpH [Thermoanaerobacterium butyriciformans]